MKLYFYKANCIIFICLILILSSQTINTIRVNNNNLNKFSNKISNYNNNSNKLANLLQLLNNDKTISGFYTLQKLYAGPEVSKLFTDSELETKKKYITLNNEYLSVSNSAVASELGN